MYTETADVIAEMRDAMLDMADDANLTADDYTADCAPGDDASQAEAWRQWCGAIRRRCIAEAMHDHLRNVAEWGGTMLDLQAVANDADGMADGIMAEAIAAARESAPDSWVAHHAAIL